jgi:hypothetical protein
METGHIIGLVLIALVIILGIDIVRSHRKAWEAHEQKKKERAAARERELQAMFESGTANAMAGISAAAVHSANQVSESIAAARVAQAMAQVQEKDNLAAYEKMQRAIGMDRAKGQVQATTRRAAEMDMMEAVKHIQCGGSVRMPTEIYHDTESSCRQSSVDSGSSSSCSNSDSGSTGSSSD